MWICSRPVNRNDKAIRCDSCFHWIHYKCNGLSLNDFCLLQSSNEVWYCKHCIASIFPFSSVDDSELHNLMNCRIPSHLEFLPSLDVLSKISGIPYLDNSDIDNNIPNPINSKYYYFHDFEKMTLSSNKSYFSLFNVNLYVASVNTTQYGLRSLKFTGPRLWNSLPTSITNSNSLRIFRKTLKDSMLNCYSN